MATDQATSSRSKPLDGFSESGDMYWGMITNQAKALRNPNPDALGEQLAEVLEEPNDVALDSEQSGGLFSNKDVAVMASTAAGKVAPQVAGSAASGSTGSGSSGSSGSTGSSGSSGSTDSSDDESNSALAGITKGASHRANPAAAATGEPIKSSGPPLTGEKLRIAKFELLSKLNDLQNRGVSLSQDYDMNSDYDVMQREYNIHLSIRNKQVIVSMYDQGFSGAVNLTEFVNETYNPFNFKLKGMSKAVNAERDIYRDIWGDFYEMYHKNDKMIHPVLRLGFALGNTITNHHIANSRADADAAEKARTNKYIEEQVKMQLATAGLQAPAVSTSQAGRPTYDDMVRHNAELERKVAYLNANTSKILEQMAAHDRRMQASAPGVSAIRQQPSAQQSPAMQPYGAPRYPTHSVTHTADSRRLDDHLGRMSLNESKSRHSALMREQDRIIKGSSQHRHARDSTVSDASETEGTETDSPDERHSRKSKSRGKGHLSSSVSESQSSRSSARSTTTDNSRNSKRKHRAIKIDTEQIR